MVYSVLHHFSQSSVLLTGSSGYVGSLVLEKLLRCTDVAAVYVLMRPKRDVSIEDRLKQLLGSPVFHLLRGNPVLAKVRPVAGDMLTPGLGISAADLLMLQREVDTVIHCAADIRLEVGIQELLRANYEGTRQLLNLARSFAHLVSFVHVSSAYTNMNQPKGSLIKEAIYPLFYGDAPVDDHELVQELLAMPSHNANERAEGLMAHWNFPNNYTLSKHLAEYLVADYHKYFKLPIAILRPTLISSVAQDPYPGFTGNFAGHVGATLAFMAGLFNSPYASNYKPSNVWDVIPADICANVILATAAAVGCGQAANCIATPTSYGRLAATAPLSHRPGSSDRLAQLGRSGKGGGAKQQRSSGGGGGQQAAYALQAFSGGEAEPHLVVKTSAPPGGQGPQQHDSLLIIHCGSSTIYPLTIMESWNWGVEVYGAWPRLPKLVLGCAGPMTPEQEPMPTLAAYYMAWTGWKIWAATSLLKLFGEDRIAKKLSVGFESFKIINQPKTDVNLRFSTANMQRLAAKLERSEGSDFLLLWKPAAQPAKPGASAVVPGAAPRFGLSLEGSKGEQAAAAAALLNGSVGGGVIRAALPGSISSSRCASVRSEGPGSGASSDAELHSSDCEDAHSSSSSSPNSCGASSSSSSSPSSRSPRNAHGAKLSLEQQELVAQMRAIPLQWRDFHINMGAFLYCTVFRMPLPANRLPITDEHVVSWLNIKPADRAVNHQFRLFK